MGWGDEIIATGLARGAAARGKRIAFGDGKAIRWDQRSKEIFRGNPNVAPPGSEGAKDVEWVHYFKGHRLYGDARSGRWKFNDFKCPEGEIYFSEEERAFANISSKISVVVEPRVKDRGACDGANKRWPVERYQVLVDELEGLGFACAQLVPKDARPLLRTATAIYTPTFRHALAALSKVKLYIGPEGGLHHGSAAVGTKAVVLFGGFNTPRSTGYDWHCNIAVDPPCGSIGKCEHCQKAMASITVEQVVEAALGQLNGHSAG